MALFDEDYDVRMAEGYVREAEAHLANQKFNRDQAKANGNYRNSSKYIRLPNGSLGNNYDSNVYNAQELLKRRKAELAKAKEKAKEAKKRKQEEAKKKASSSSSSSSSKRSSSSSSSSSYSSRSSSSSSSVNRSTESKSTSDSEQALKVHELVDTYRTTLEGKYKIANASDTDLVMYIAELRDESGRWKKEANAAGCEEFNKKVFLEWKSVVDSFCYRASNRLKDLYLEGYVKSLDKRYPIENASADDLAKLLPALVEEIATQDGECKKNASDTTLRLIYNAYKQAVTDVARKACLRLKKLDRTLFEKLEVQQFVKKIDPRLESTFINKTIDTLLAPYIWFEDKKSAVTKWFDGKENAAIKWLKGKENAANKWLENKEAAVRSWISKKMKG